MGLRNDVVGGGDARAPLGKGQHADVYAMHIEVVHGLRRSQKSKQLQNGRLVVLPPERIRYSLE